MTLDSISELRRTWRLVVRGAGYLKYFAGGRELLKLALHPRYVRLLEILLEARRDDETSEDGVDGWRTRDEIGRLMGHTGMWDLPNNTVTNYGSKILALVAKAWLHVGAAGPMPRLLEFHRGRGWRIADGVDLEVVKPEVQP